MKALQWPMSHASPVTPSSTDHAATSPSRPATGRDDGRGKAPGTGRSLVLAIAVAGLVGLVGIGGCSSTGVGATLGGAAGAASGHGAKGAIGGAVVGGVIGHEVGKRRGDD